MRCPGRWAGGAQSAKQSVPRSLFLPLSGFVCLFVFFFAFSLSKSTSLWPWWKELFFGGVLGWGWGGGVGRKDEMVSDCELGRSAFSAEESRILRN